MACKTNQELNYCTNLLASAYDCAMTVTITTTVFPFDATKRDHEHEKHTEHKQLTGSGISAVKVLYFTGPWIHCETRPGHTVLRPSSAAGHVCGKGTTTPKYT